MEGSVLGPLPLGLGHSLGVGGVWGRDFLILESI